MRKIPGVASLAARRQIKATLTLALVLTFVTPASFAAGVTVSPGASFTLGSGSLVMNCLDLTVSGQFSAGEGRVEAGRDISILSGGDLNGGSSEIVMSGDWSNSGSFSPGFSSIQNVDGCGRNTSAITGNSAFFSFEATTSSGRTLRPEAGRSQVFQDNLVLTGMPGSHLMIRSSNPGSLAFFTLRPGGTQLIQRVDVADNSASGGQVLAPGTPAESNSVNAGNILHWFDILSVLDEIFTDGFEAQN